MVRSIGICMSERGSSESSDRWRNKTGTEKRR